MSASELGTIDNDLDSQILNRDQETEVAKKLRQIHQRSKPKDSIEKLVSLAPGGIGINSSETDRKKQDRKKDPSSRLAGSGQANFSQRSLNRQEQIGEQGVEPSMNRQAPSAGSGQATSSRLAGSGQVGQDSSGFDSRLARASGRGRTGNEEKDEDKQKNEKASASAKASADKEEQEPPSIRQKLAKARQAANLKKRAKEKLEEKVAAPVNKGTKRLLKSAWRSMFSVIAFLPALLYINGHVFLRWVVGDKFFCKLGEEWVPEQAKAIVGETPNKTFGTIEIAILLILDVIAFVIIGAVLTLLVMIVNFETASWWDKAKMFIDLGWDGIKALIALF